ncbi:MAG: non-hydrolyzing UDP-N-acetylglucosamine 2-epimerase [Terriglobia bacterium]
MEQPKRVIHVVGARPNYMKVAPLMREMGKKPESWQQVLTHTGQHYDHHMSEVFFQDLGLPQPDVYLGIGSGSHSEQYARVLLAFEPVLKERRPDWVIVVGDVNSTLACALCAAQMGVRVAHVEAGLRSCDRSMPEEINRIVTDHLSDLLFTSEPSGNQNLIGEGIPAEKIRFVGNTMIDSLASMLPRTENASILKQLGLCGSENGKRNASTDAGKPWQPYVLVTLHRPSNVDEPAALGEILSALDVVARDLPVIFPVHPRTRRRIEENRLLASGQHWRLMEPLGYIDFLTLQRHAALVITDSGGIQEETTYLGVPCLTVRPNTERPVTIALGTNRLVERRSSAILQATHDVLRGARAVKREPPSLWDGHAAERIVSELDQA